MILLVEDNKKIMDANVRKFVRAGYEIACARTLAEARAFLQQQRPQLIVLDILLPDGNGLQFIEELRQGDAAAVPILLLTGLSESKNITQGLRAGGDDYLTKPYQFDELFARIEALLRRATRVPDTITKGRLTIDLTAAIAKYDGKDLLLAKKEYALLLLFIQHEERSFTAEYLYEKVWGTSMEKDNNALKGAIKRLRAKIEGCGWSIGWNRGEGYIFEQA